MTEFLKIGLLGWPVAHSKSPAIHSLFMDKAGIKGEYHLFPVKPESLSLTVNKLRREGFTGLNVTVPNKKHAIKLCTSLSRSAQISGAVNTLLFQGGDIQGFNTDLDGFRALSKDLQAPYLVLGKGGVALAVQAVAGPENCRLLGRGETVSCSSMGERGTVVNATPLGWNNDDSFPIHIPSGWSFIDLNYNPRWKWRNSLSARGIRVATGESMLVEQAACSFCLWTGYTPGDEIKTEALEMIKAEFNG